MSLEDHVKCYPNTLKTKLLPLCRTHWVERLNALEVTLDLTVAVTNTFSDRSQNIDTQWNRDTIAQATFLIKSIDFDFIFNLVVTQKVLFYTSGITTSLQTRGIDLVNIGDQVQLTI